jgi:ribosomal protein L3 glutamine methyltransferase
VTVGQLIETAARQLDAAGVFFGHGTDNARDEAAALIWHALQLPWKFLPALYRRPVGVRGQLAVQALLERRIRERIPAVYLTGEIWFAGLPLRIDPRALIPRSPLAELIEAQFRPWVEPRRVRRILDLCTGSGCIAIACAKYLPASRVDATDVAPQALELARENVRRHRLSRRVRCVKSDYFAALRGRRYDIIVSNPPYVGARELASLPAEYRHEPRMALAAGRDGLDAVRVILAQAAEHLSPRGVLIVEVGNTEAAARRTFRRLPFTWLEFERGGGGVFLLTREQLLGE